jgi:acetyl-CoA synthetase
VRAAGRAAQVIFGGFSSQAIADRVEDAKSEIIITADGGRAAGRSCRSRKTSMMR